MRSTNSIVFALDGTGTPRAGSHSSDFVKLAGTTLPRTPLPTSAPADPESDPDWVPRRWVPRYQDTQAYADRHGLIYRNLPSVKRRIANPELIEVGGYRRSDLNKPVVW